MVAAEAVGEEQMCSTNARVGGRSMKMRTEVLPNILVAVTGVSG